jgi:hypothetical protein
MLFFPVTTSGFKYSLLIAEFKYSHPRDENKDQIPEGGETKSDQIPHICPPLGLNIDRCIIKIAGQKAISVTKLDNGTMQLSWLERCIVIAEPQV